MSTNWATSDKTRHYDVPGDADSLELRPDTVTKLADRWQFDVWLGQELEQERRRDQRCGVLLFSVANLASINANYGNGVGDEVLRVVAKALAQSVGTQGRIARYVGSELAVLWPGLDQHQDVSEVAEQLTMLLPEQATFHSFVVPLDIRVAAAAPESGARSEPLLNELQRCLSEMRAEGDSRSIGVVTVNARRPDSTRPEVLAVRLQQAFDNDEFRMVYQPIVSLARGRVVGFESFLRWSAHDPVGGAELVAPGVFLDALRLSPVVVPLHAWILKESLKQVAVWDAQLGGAAVFCSVNLDPSFILDERFEQTVRSTIEQSSLRSNQLLLDIKSDTIGPMLARTWPPLRDAKTHGVGIALEDFGVGFGSAELLKHCQFDVIRLPRQATRNLGLAEEDTIIVSSLIDLAHKMKCAVIAEGVETEQQAEILAKLGTDFVQGFLFGRPADGPTLSAELAGVEDQARRFSPSRLV